MVMATETEKETEPIPSVKDLASSDPSLRRKNLQQILSHLESRPSDHHLTYTQALQLWRGFHVSLYMHDSKNQLSVQTLIATLASTFKIIRRKDREAALGTPSSNSNPSETKKGASTKGIVSQDGEDEFADFDDTTSNRLQTQDTPSSQWLSTYSKAFWETMAREWSGVDQWRMNKFLSLIRFALREILDISLLAYYGAEAELEDENATENKQSEQQASSTTSEKTKSKKRKGANETNDSSSTSSQTTKKAKTSPDSTSSNTNPQPRDSHSQTPDHTAATTQLALLTTYPLSPRDRKTSNDGLRLHVLDIYVDELFRAVTSLQSHPNSQQSATTTDSQDLRSVLETTFMGPVKTISVDGLSRNVRTKAKEVLVEFEGRVGEEVLP